MIAPPPRLEPTKLPKTVTKLPLVQALQVI
jgi:hypothetical protein